MTRNSPVQIVFLIVVSAAVGGEATTEHCPLLIDRSLTPARGVAVVGADSTTSGAFAFVGAGAVLKVVNVSEPTRPIVIASVVLPDVITTVAASHDFAYAWTWSAGLRVIDVRDPYNPREVGFLDHEGASGYVDAVVADRYAFVTFRSIYGGATPDSRIRVVDLNDPTEPFEIASYDGEYGSLTVSGSFLYAVASNDPEGGWMLEVIDVSDPEEPVGLGSYQAPTGDWASDLAGEGSFAYVSTRSGLVVIDATNPAAPTHIATVDMPYNRSLAVADGFVYAHASSYFDVIDVRKPSKPTRVDFCELPCTYGDVSEMSVFGDHVFVSHGCHGLVVVDVSLPSDPQMVGRLCNGWPRHVEVFGQYAYWVTWATSGRWDLRISDLRGSRKGETTACLQTEDEILKVAVSGSYGYLAVRDKKLLVVDIDDPVAPRQVGSLETQHPIIDLTVREGYAYLFLDGVEGLSIVDVSEPSTPRQVGWHALVKRGAPRGLAISGDHAYLTTASSLQVINVSEPTEPRLVAVLDNPAGAISVWEPYAYLAADIDGLRIIDISEPLVPHEIGSLALFSSSPYEPKPAVSIAATKHLVYVVTMYGGMHIVDVRDPTEPRELRFLPDIEAIDFAVSGAFAVIAHGQGGLSVLDLSNCDDRINRDRTDRKGSAH